jgi:hypothetical protein
MLFIRRQVFPFFGSQNNRGEKHTNITNEKGSFKNNTNASHVSCVAYPFFIADYIQNNTQKD